MGATLSLFSCFIFPSIVWSNCLLLSKILGASTILLTHVYFVESYFVGFIKLIDIFFRELQNLAKKKRNSGYRHAFRGGPLYGRRGLTKPSAEWSILQGSPSLIGPQRGPQTPRGLCGVIGSTQKRPLGPPCRLVDEGSAD